MSERASPLTPEQQSALADARDRTATFSPAARIASFNAWSIGFFAVVSILCGSTSLTSLVVGIGLAVVARNEFVGGARVRALNPSGFELLWRNQVAFMALIIGYCFWSMYRAVATPDPQMAELTELLGDGTEELVQSLTLTVYAVVIAATLIFQGLNARYYYVRLARLKSFIKDTPPWVLDVQRSVTPK